ncbi:MAG: Lipoprotein [Sphingobacteriales bacterium]|nr:Lipoprotein [Sphingobacteriales bacterium]
MNYLKKGLFLLGSGISLMSMLSACSTVKSYQKNKINDSEMALSSRTAQKFEQSFELYREGASGANGGKSGGGCGCN